MNEKWLTPRDGLNQLGFWRTLALITVVIAAMALGYIVALVYLVGLGA